MRQHIRRFSNLSSRYQGLDRPTVWHEFTPLASQLGAINLGQGFPDFDTPTFVKSNFINAVTSGANQYCRSAGHTPLVEELGKRYSVLLDREINPLDEIAITNGASGALHSVMQALLEPGDEVITFSPFFDIYRPQVSIAGGSLVSVPLRSAASCTSSFGVEYCAAERFALDVDALKAAVTGRTKLILLNTPHNPSGKMFNEEEMDAIAGVVRENERIVVVTDEVYEAMTYEHAPLSVQRDDAGNVSLVEERPTARAAPRHLRFAQRPNMWDRTLSVSSAGKTFSCTGWKIGWVVGPPTFTKAIQLVNQYAQFSVCTPAQEAIAHTLKEADEPFEGFPSYYAWLRAEYTRKRRILAQALLEGGITPIIPDGGFFIMGDTSQLEVPQEYLSRTSPAAPVMTRDWALCSWLAHEARVVAIPPSAFYSEDDAAAAAPFARFAFCKTDDALEDAAAHLSAFKARQQ